MSRHIAPHRWADAWAGRVEAAELDAMARHAASCRACAKARERVTRASDSFPTIRTQSAPELSWDAVRARVHWSVSKERRSQPEAPRRAPGIVWGLLAIAAAGGLALVAGGGLSSPRAPVVHARRPVEPSPGSADVAITPRPAQLAGLVSRVSGEVMINGVRPADLFARHLGAGVVLATGAGRIDVQFGDASAFALGPRSTLELRKFDDHAIELAVDGTVDVEVSARRAGQRFVVISGDQTIEVRGTQFRVNHEAGSTTVACRHGLVAVRDPHGELEVAAARRVHVRAGDAVSDEHVVALSVEELDALAESTPMTLPMWDLDTLSNNSAPLEIATSGPRDVRLDGVEVGRAPLRVRVMPGRHTVEAADSAGRFRRAGWVDVTVPTRGGKPARLEVQAEPAPTAGVDQRRRQLKAGIEQAHPSLGRCTRSIAKQGLTSTYVEIEISIDATGAVGFLNVIDTDLGVATSHCIRDVLADVRFGPGVAATWRERIDL